MADQLSPVFVAYVEDEDRFYLVSADQSVALPTPPALHGHMGELVSDMEDRLGCHPGFVQWPLGGRVPE